jgi:hypothetical protein
VRRHRRPASFTALVSNVARDGLWVLARLPLKRGASSLGESGEG